MTIVPDSRGLLGILWYISLMWHSTGVWFSNHEWFAIWLEGIALVLIFIWDRIDAYHQHKHTEEQLNAAIAAAEAAKKSADLSAAIQRPHMGVWKIDESILVGAAGWEIVVTMKNYGQLPATKVGMVTEFLIDGNSLHTQFEPTSYQVFPTDEFSAQIYFPLGVVERQRIRTGNKKLLIKVKIMYGEDAGRQFEYTTTSSYKSGRFVIDNSETREVFRPAGVIVANAVTPDIAGRGAADFEGPTGK
jgi:hypothetical protein